MLRYVFVTLLATAFLTGLPTVYAHVWPPHPSQADSFGAQTEHLQSALSVHGDSLAAPTATAASKKVVTEGLYLIDREGRTRAILDINDGGPMLRFLDKSGTTRASFGLNYEDQPQVALLGSNGEPRAALRLHDDETPELTLYGNEGREQVWVGVLKSGKPYLAVYGEDLTEGASFVFTDDEAPQLKIEYEEEAAFLSLAEGGRAYLGSYYVQPAPVPTRPMPTSTPASAHSATTPEVGGSATITPVTSTATPPSTTPAPTTTPTPRQ
ncbi:MAG: hypothetical protein ACUVX1_11335 [Chloroflexota bacterium]